MKVFISAAIKTISFAILEIWKKFRSRQNAIFNILRSCTKLTWQNRTEGSNFFLLRMSTQSQQQQLVITIQLIRKTAFNFCPVITTIVNFNFDRFAETEVKKTTERSFDKNFSLLS